MKKFIGSRLNANRSGLCPMDLTINFLDIMRTEDFIEHLYLNLSIQNKKHENHNEYRIKDTEKIYTCLPYIEVLSPFKIIV